MAARSKTLAIGTAEWALEERTHSQDLVAQELEDFGFSVRNELEWLNEHMAEIFANNGQNNLDVFKTPGKLRGKTPRTARKKIAAEVRQPLGDIFDATSNIRQSPALQALQNLQKPSPKARFHVAEDAENVSPVRSSPLKSPAALLPAFSKQPTKAKAIAKSPLRLEASHDTDEEPPQPRHLEVDSIVLPPPSSQDTVDDTQDDVPVFTQDTFPSFPSTQATQSFRHSWMAEKERRETGDSFVSAKEDLANKNPSKNQLTSKAEDNAMAVDERDLHIAQDVSMHDHFSPREPTFTAIRDEPPRSTRQNEMSGAFSIGAETYEALDTAHIRAHAPEPKNFVGIAPAAVVPSEPEPQHEDTVLHHEVDDEMEVDDEAHSRSDDSSPVRPLVRKSSLTFASLPAREPLVPNKSIGSRLSRTSYLDQSRSRITGGKSLGGSQYMHTSETHDDAMDEDGERPVIQPEESETTKMHNTASTKTLKERLNMLNQRTEPAKRISQHVVSQPIVSAPSQPTQSTQPTQSLQTSQPTYPILPPAEPEHNDDDEDSWISPIRTAAPAPPAPRPLTTNSYSAESRPPSSDDSLLPKDDIVSDPVPPSGEESTTPAGSPTASRKYMDGPLSASKAKFYSALRAAKDKIIGSSAASTQVRMDTTEGARTKLQATASTEDIFTTTPKRSEKNGIFSHLRSPSKESEKSIKAAKPAPVLNSSSSPAREEGRRTRSSSERERKDNETREREVKLKQRAEVRLKEMREKEQSKAAAHHQKAKATAKTPAHAASQANSRPGLIPNYKTPVAAAHASQSRPGTIRTNTGARQQDVESAEEMPPPPPPKSLLPTTGHKLREPKRLVKPNSKETIPKGKPQKIQVNLHSSRFGQAPPPAKAPSAAPPKMAPPPATNRQAQPAPKQIVPAKPGPVSRLTSTAPKPAPRVARTQPTRPAEKPRPTPAQPRADLGVARPVSRLQTVQDAVRVNVPPVNPAKPPVKRPFQAESDESLHRPAKRPSQQARSKPMTPAHAQFASGKIPFAEPSQPAPATQYPNGDDIELPSIMTDSEDEGSDGEFEQPSWVATPNLHSMLEQQQLMDPEQIFGPIAPLNMEQVFPNKERHKRFRERTSSAYWHNDQVTEEERRKEREARERLVREGAWTYNPSPRPTQPYKQ